MLLILASITATSLTLYHSPRAAAVPRCPPVLASAAAIEPLIQTIESVDALREAVAEAEKAKQLCVVKFYAPFCRTCRRIEPAFEKLAQKMPQHRFLQVNFKEQPGVCKESNIRALPTMHVYSQGELVAQPQMPARAFKAFAESLRERARELSGVYVPQNSCDDSFWVCDGGDECSITQVSYDEFSP